MFRFDFRSREYGGKLILIDSFNLANLCASIKEIRNPSVINCVKVTQRCQEPYDF